MSDARWLKSADVRKLLKISTCDLAHLRQEGKIRFVKKGNAYLYSSDDCKELSQSTRENSGGACSIDKQSP